MKKKEKIRKKKREMLKDFLKKNVKEWKVGTKHNPMPQTRKTTA